MKYKHQKDDVGEPRCGQSRRERGVEATTVILHLHRRIAGWLAKSRRLRSNFEFFRLISNRYRFLICHFWSCCRSIPGGRLRVFCSYCLLRTHCQSFPILLCLGNLDELSTQAALLHECLNLAQLNVLVKLFPSVYKVPAATLPFSIHRAVPRASTRRPSGGNVEVSRNDKMACEGAQAEEDSNRKFPGWRGPL